jgi:CelD/BcsL family acetyltransferase involved in cellulose biosynthesis
VGVHEDNLTTGERMTTYAPAQPANDARDGDPSERLARHHIVEMDELGSAHIERWLDLRSSNPALDSPYFHPAFTAAVASTRPGVRVIVGEAADGSVASFLPVQFDKRTCRPAGWPAADFQGPICAPNVDFDITAALRGAKIGSYEFDHMLDGLPGFEPWIFDREPSSYVDVSGGLDGYMSRGGGTGKRRIKDAARLGRKAEREYGPVRTVVESTDSSLLDVVIALKQRQYQATGARDYFADPRHVELMHRLLATGNDLEFGGPLSAVYAGEHLIAAHFGMRAGPVLHWWFPVYDPEFSRLDPGWMQVRAVLEAAPELGVERIDLGRGDGEWKRWLGTGYQLVCQGAVIRNPLRHRTASARRRFEQAAKSSPAAPALRSVVRYARRRSR